MKNFSLILFGSLLLAACTTPTTPQDNAMPKEPMKKMFTVTLHSPENGGGPLAPGVFVVHKDGMPLFKAGEKDRGQGLEALAEDGNPAALSSATGSTVFNTPKGDAEPGPATPGKSYQFTFMAEPGDKLSFASMYVQSNDLFYAPEAGGFELFQGNTPITGDMTGKIMLWDAGTEVNQKPGEGADQAPRQSGPNTGESESEAIEMVSKRDSYSYPSALKFTIEAK